MHFAPGIPILGLRSRGRFSIYTGFELLVWMAVYNVGRKTLETVNSLW